MLACRAGRGKRVLIPAEAVVEDCGRPVDGGQPESLSPANHLAHAGLDELGGRRFAALDGGEQQATVRREAAPGHVGDRLRLFDLRHGRGEVAGEEARPGERVERDWKLRERAGIAGELDLADGQLVPDLVVPELVGSVAGEPEPADLLFLGD